jgi:phasin family protein
MTDNPFFQNWFKTMSNMQTTQQNPMDMKSMMDQGRKTFQAITEAQQLCMESLQVIAQRQAEIMSQMVKDQGEIAREIAGETTPEKKISKGADLIRQSYEKTVVGAREMTDMLQKSTREAGDILNRRVNGALNEIKSTVSDAADDNSETTKNTKKSRGKVA